MASRKNLPVLGVNLPGDPAWLQILALPALQPVAGPIPTTLLLLFVTLLAAALQTCPGHSGENGDAVGDYPSKLKACPVAQS